MVTSPSGAELGEYLRFARSLGDWAKAKILSGLAEGIAASFKQDKTFITQIDTAVEAGIRDRVAAAYPSHGVAGEEFPPLNSHAEFQWILDPVDGTHNLVHGVPTFGSIIGLWCAGRPIVGVVEHPLLKLSYWAALGLGSFENGRRLCLIPRKMGPIAESEILTLSARQNFTRSQAGWLFDQLVSRYPLHRIYADVFAHTRVVAGQASLGIDANAKRWDLAATPILITEAGGSYLELPVLDSAARDAEYIFAVYGPKGVPEFYREAFDGWQMECTS